MWIEPLDLKTWILNVFSGNPDYFTAIALFVITGMSAYFRMNGLMMFFMIGIFILMFGGTLIHSPLFILFAIMGGLLIGMAIRKVFQ